MSEAQSAPPAASPPASPLGARAAALVEKVRRAGVAVESPLLVRELRTLLRGRKFFVSHIIVLVVLSGVLLIAATTSAMTGSGDSSAVGTALFWSFVVGLGTVVIFLVPAFSCTALTTERESKTLELLLTTTIRPWEIVWGKLLSALVVILLFMVSALPLVTVCFLFGGISPWDLAMLYLGVTFCTMVVSSMSLAVSAFCRESKSSVVIAYVLTIVFLGLVFFGGAWMVDEFSGSRGLDAFRSWFSGLPWDEKAMLLIVPQFLGAGAFALNFAAAANRLKPATVNRTTGVRAIWLACLVGAVVLYMLGLHVAIEHSRLGGGDWEAVMILTLSLAAPFLWISALFFASDETRLSPRLMEDSERLGGLRLPLRIFMPGPASGLAFVAVCTALLLGGTGLYATSCAMAFSEGEVGWRYLQAALPAGLFVLTAAGIAAFLSGCGLKRTGAGFAAFGFSVLLAFGPLIHLGCRQAVAGDDAPSTLWNMHYLSPVLAMISGWAEPGSGRMVTFFAPDEGQLPVPGEGLPLWLVSTAAYALLAMGVWALALTRIAVTRSRWKAELAAAQAAARPAAPAGPPAVTGAAGEAQP